MYIPHTKITFGGDLGTGTNPEGWTCSLHIGGDGVNAQVSSQTDGEQAGIVQALKDWIANPNMGINQLATMRFVKFAFIDPAGRYAEDAKRYDLPATIKGTAGPSAVKPFQVAHCLTLHTGKRGAQNRGRFYSPLPTLTLSPDGLVGLADCEAIGTATASLLSQINLTLFNDTKLIVASSKGHNSFVTGVTVGRVLDTVRSRRRSLKESYPADTVVTQA